MTSLVTVIHRLASFTRILLSASRTRNASRAVHITAFLACMISVADRVCSSKLRCQMSPRKDVETYSSLHTLFLKRKQNWKSNRLNDLACRFDKCCAEVRIDITATKTVAFSDVNQLAENQHPFDGLSLESVVHVREPECSDSYVNHRCFLNQVVEHPHHIIGVLVQVSKGVKEVKEVCQKLRCEDNKRQSYCTIAPLSTNTSFASESEKSTPVSR